MTITPFELVSSLERIAETDLANAQAIRRGALAMESLMLAEPPSVGVEIFDSLSPATVESLQQLYERFETDLEYEFADKVIAGHAEVEDYPLHERFVRLIEGEAEIADIKPEHRILFIGSGPFPISPILFAQLTGAQVDCLDFSKEACETSEKVIEKLVLKDKITVINGDGQSTDLSGHDVVVVALLAQPKVEICANINRSCPKNTPVVVRCAPGTRSLFYRGIDDKAEDRIRRYSFSIYNWQFHRAGVDDTISSSLAHVRKSVEKF